MEERQLQNMAANGQTAKRFLTSAIVIYFLLIFLFKTSFGEENRDAKTISREYTCTAGPNTRRICFVKVRSVKLISLFKYFDLISIYIIKYYIIK